LVSGHRPRYGSGVVGFPTSVAAQASGLSVDQIRYLQERRVLTPSIANPRGRGKAVRWSFEDLLAMRVIHALRSAGEAPTPLIAAALMELRKLGRQNPAGRILVFGEQQTFSLVDAASLSVLAAEAELLLAVALGPVADALRGRLAELGIAAPAYAAALTDAA
jgi:DNA-binding transcriptional MerR regulator